MPSIRFDAENAGTEEAAHHFAARAERYNRSSRWVVDPELARRMLSLTEPGPEDRVLDVACGTGLVAQHYKGRAAEVVGFDLTPAMFAQAAPHVDRMVEGRAEDLPFEDGSFDLVVCRQGIQFMRDGQAVQEMVRVLRPGGRVCLIHLCAYGSEDREAYFEILRLRNPARRNFYMRQDLARLLEAAGCSDVAVHDYISVEDVDAWSDTGAIPEQNRERIREVYRAASPEFHRLHAVKHPDTGGIVDHMLFGLAIGVRGSA